MICMYVQYRPQVGMGSSSYSSKQPAASRDPGVCPAAFRVPCSFWARADPDPAVRGPRDKCSRARREAASRVPPSTILFSPVRSFGPEAVRASVCVTAQNRARPSSSSDIDESEECRECGPRQGPLRL